jgi:hypothetical protein
MSRLRLSAAFVVLFAAVLSFHTFIQAFEIPLREVVLGDTRVSLLDYMDDFERSLTIVEGSYFDIYRMKSPSTRHDYHMGGFRLSTLFRSGRLLYGFDAGRSELTLKQDNVYTRADRLRGGRVLTEGGLLFGLETSARRLPLGVKDVLLLGSLGWDEGASASCEGRLKWRRHFELLFRAETFSREIDLSQDINGYRFPFVFPFRTSRIFGEGSMKSGELGIDVRGGFELTRGEGGGKLGFENKLYFRRRSVGVSVSLGLERCGIDARACRRTCRCGKLPGISLSADHRGLEGDVGMYRNDVRYAYLQDIALSNTIVSLDVAPLAGAWISFGWEKYTVRHDGDSFVDVWPFTVWDVFVAKRYRLGHVDGRLDTWFLGLGTAGAARRFEYELRARWEWWHDKGALRWLEREDIVYPVFFKYIAHNELLQVKNRFAIQIEPDLSFRASGRIKIVFSGRLTVPFGRETEERPGGAPPPSPAAPSEEKQVRGGLIGRIAVVYSF